MPDFQEETKRVIRHLQRNLISLVDTAHSPEFLKQAIINYLEQLLRTGPTLLDTEEILRPHARQHEPPPRIPAKIPGPLPDIVYPFCGRDPRAEHIDAGRDRGLHKYTTPNDTDTIIHGIRVPPGCDVVELPSIKPHVRDFFFVDGNVRHFVSIDDRPMNNREPTARISFHSTCPKGRSGVNADNRYQQNIQEDIGGPSQGPVELAEELQRNLQNHRYENGPPGRIVNNPQHTHNSAANVLQHTYHSCRHNGSSPVQVENNLQHRKDIAEQFEKVRCTHQSQRFNDGAATQAADILQQVHRCVQNIQQPTYGPQPCVHLVPADNLSNSNQPARVRGCPPTQSKDDVHGVRYAKECPYPDKCVHRTQLSQKFCRTPVLLRKTNIHRPRRPPEESTARRKLNLSGIKVPMKEDTLASCDEDELINTDKLIEECERKVRQKVLNNGCSSDESNESTTEFEKKFREKYLHQNEELPQPSEEALADYERKFRKKFGLPDSNSSNVVYPSCGPWSCNRRNSCTDQFGCQEKENFKRNVNFQIPNDDAERKGCHKLDDRSTSTPDLAGSENVAAFEKRLKEKYSMQDVPTNQQSESPAQEAKNFDNVTEFEAELKRKYAAVQLVEPEHNKQNCIEKTERMESVERAESGSQFQLNEQEPQNNTPEGNIGDPEQSSTMKRIQKLFETDPSIDGIGGIVENEEACDHRENIEVDSEDSLISEFQEINWPKKSTDDQSESQ